MDFQVGLEFAFTFKCLKFSEYAKMRVSQLSGTLLCTCHTWWLQVNQLWQRRDMSWDQRPLYDHGLIDGMAWIINHINRFMRVWLLTHALTLTLNHKKATRIIFKGKMYFRAECSLMHIYDTGPYWVKCIISCIFQLVNFPNPYKFTYICTYDFVRFQIDTPKNDPM